MAIQVTEGTFLGEELDTQSVSNAFVTQYYLILHQSPELLYQFYKEQSVLEWPKLDGSMASATTKQGIKDMIMSSDYKGCLVEIVNAYAQDSLMDGIILAVTGRLIGKDKLRKIFCQTFFLAKQERGYFVLNDIFRFVDAQESLNSSSASDMDEKAKIASFAHDPELADVTCGPQPLKMPTCTEATGSVETGTKVTDTAAEVPRPSITPSQNVEHEGQKISYASVVAKKGKISSLPENFGNRIIRVAAKADQQPSASPAPTSNSVTKKQPSASPAPTSNSVTKNQSSSSNGSTETDNNNSKSDNSNIHAEVVISKTVYIQNLPSDVTKNDLAEAVKKFGRVRPAGIQLKRFEDGFCFGFVEFESPSSAKSAVEAHIITLRGNEARISYRKSGTRAGNGNRANGGFRTGNLKGQDGRAYGGDAYPRNSRRNDESWSNGDAQQQNFRSKNEKGESLSEEQQKKERRAASEGGTQHN